MEEQFVWAIEYRRANFGGWVHLTMAQSEDVAKRYMRTLYPSLMMWYRRHGYSYARRRLDNGDIVTYRVSKREVVTAEQVDIMRARKLARMRAQQEAAASQ